MSARSLERLNKALESSEDEEEEEEEEEQIVLITHNGSKEMLGGNDVPSGECEKLIQDLKKIKTNHVPMLLAMAVGLYSGPSSSSRQLANFESETDVWKLLPKASVPKVPMMK